MKSLVTATNIGRRKHGCHPSDIRDLPKAMEHPIAVFRLYEGSFAVLVELKMGDLNGLTTLQVGKGKVANFNIVTSIYDKDYDKIVGWINSGKLIILKQRKDPGFLALPRANCGNPQETRVCYGNKDANSTRVINPVKHPPFPDEFGLRRGMSSSSVR